LRPAAGHRLHGGKPGKEGGRPASAPPDRGAARPGAAAGAAAVRPGGPAAPDPARDRPAFGHQPQLCFPPGVPRAGPAAPELVKLKFPAFARQFGLSDRSLRAWESEKNVISKGCWEKYFQTRTAVEHLGSKHPASVHPFSFPPNYGIL